MATNEQTIPDDDELGVESVSYPLTVDYCGLCSMPPEVGCTYLGLLGIPLLYLL